MNQPPTAPYSPLEAKSGYPEPYQMPQPPPPYAQQAQDQVFVSAQPQPQVIQSQPQVIFMGNCPKCHRGNIQEDFTCCGICWAICCFPIGLICMMTMKEKKCNMCGAIF